jgi:hypothetical protein
MERRQQIQKDQGLVNVQITNIQENPQKEQHWRETFTATHKTDYNQGAYNAAKLACCSNLSACAPGWS